MSNLPPHWPRRLQVRTRRMYKKAAELSRLESDVRVTVLVSSGGSWAGYLGHGAREWPELYQLLATHAIAKTTIDDLETVSQRRESAALAQWAQISVSERLALLEQELQALREAQLSSMAREANNSHAAGDLRPSAQVSARAAICDLTQDLPETSLTRNSSSKVLDRSDYPSAHLVPRGVKPIIKLQTNQTGKHYSLRKKET